MTDHANVETIISAEIAAFLAESPWQSALTSRDGTILALSQALLDLLNGPPEAFVGQPIERLVLEHERSGIRSLFDAVEYRTPLRAHLFRGDQLTVAVELELFPIAGDPAGRVTLVVYPVSIRHRRERIILAFNRLVPRLLEAQSAIELYNRAAHELSPLGMGMLVIALEPDQASLRIEYLSLKPGLLDVLYRIAKLDLQQLRIPRSAPFFNQVLERRQALFSDTFRPLFQTVASRQAAAIYQRIVELSALPGFILAPLLAGAQVRGALMVWSHVLNQEQVPFVEAFAHQLAAVLTQIELRAQMDRQMQRLHSLATTARAVTTLGSLEDVLRVICTQAQELLGAELARIAAPIESTDTLKYIMSTGEGAAKLMDLVMPIGASVSGAVLRTGQGRLIADLREAPDVYAPYRQHTRARSALYQPLQHRAAALGVLIVGHSQVGYFSQDDLEYLGRYAEYAAVAIANARLHAALQDTAALNARLYREAEAVRRYLDMLIRSTPDLLVTIGQDMTMHVLNPERLAESTTYSVAQVEGQPFLGLAPDYLCSYLLELWRHVLSGRPQTFELELARPTGTPIFLIIAAALIADYGEVLAIIKDVTEQRQREAHLRQNEKLAALGAMVAGAAHELNNPLATILGLAQLQIGEYMPAELRSDLEMIEHAALRAGSIVQQLLRFASPRAPLAEPVALAPLIATTLGRLKQTLRASDVEIVLDVAPDLPPILGDRHQLEQVLFNIFQNAAQSVSANSSDLPRQLSIRAVRESNHLQLTIEDTGPGIRPEDLSRIFDPFFTTRKIGEGVGLGLAVCHTIIQQHDGRIWAQSPPGKGAMFVIQLPISHN